MTTEDHAYWRRPADPGGSGGTGGGGLDDRGRPGSAHTAEPAAPAAPYVGPPRTAPPPPGWRPPTVVAPPAPRALPAQDHARLDVEEQTAGTLTKGIGMLAGAVMLVLLLVLCGRWAF